MLGLMAGGLALGDQNYHPVVTEFPVFVQVSGQILNVDPASPPSWVDIVGPDWHPPLDPGSFMVRVSIDQSIAAEIAAEISANGVCGTWVLRFNKPFTHPPADVDPFDAPAVEGADSYSRN